MNSLDPTLSRGRYSRAHTDHIGLHKCDHHEEGEGHLTNNSEDDEPAVVYTYEALFPKSRVSSTMCKMLFAKRRHTIQIPQDYNLVPVRHSTLSFFFSLGLRKLCYSHSTGACLRLSYKQQETKPGSSAGLEVSTTEKNGAEAEVHP